MPHRHSRRTLLCVTMLAAFSLAGCGGGAERGADRAENAAPGKLQHIDGGLKLDGDDQLTVLPTTPGQKPLVLRIGPSVKRGSMQALIASGTKARVYYGSPDDPIAARVTEAPSAATGTQRYAGTITKVSSGSITIKGEDGARTFPIRSGDRAAFDTHHLEQHQRGSSPIQLYYVEDASGETHAVAYEDA